MKKKKSIQILRLIWWKFQKKIRKIGRKLKFLPIKISSLSKSQNLDRNMDQNFRLWFFVVLSSWPKFFIWSRLNKNINTIHKCQKCFPIPIIWIQIGALVRKRLKHLFVQCNPSSLIWSILQSNISPTLPNSLEDILIFWSTFNDWCLLLKLVIWKK